MNGNPSRQPFSSSVAAISEKGFTRAHSPAQKRGFGCEPSRRFRVRRRNFDNQPGDRSRGLCEKYGWPRRSKASRCNPIMPPSAARAASELNKKNGSDNRIQTNLDASVSPAETRVIDRINESATTTSASRAVFQKELR